MIFGCHTGSRETALDIGAAFVAVESAERSDSVPSSMALAGRDRHSAAYVHRGSDGGEREGTLPYKAGTGDMMVFLMQSV